MIEQGSERMYKGIEIENFLKGQMQLRLAFKTLFTKMERFMIRSNRVFVLNSKSQEQPSNTTDSDLGDFNERAVRSRYFEALLRGALPQECTQNR